MKYFPLFLNLTGKKILIVGAGKVAEQKIATLLRFTNQLTVLAKKIRPKIRRLRIKKIISPYRAQFIRGFDLVFACTGDAELNAQIKRDAQRKKIMANVADCRSLCDFIMPAIYLNQNMTVAVSSNGTDVKKAVAWRNQIKKVFSRRNRIKKVFST